MLKMEKQKQLETEFDLFSKRFFEILEDIEHLPHVISVAAFEALFVDINNNLDSRRLLFVSLNSLNVLLMYLSYLFEAEERIILSDLLDCVNEFSDTCSDIYFSC